MSKRKYADHHAMVMAKQHGSRPAVLPKETQRPPAKPSPAKPLRKANQDLKCGHRGETLGTLDCRCGGSPTVFACEVHGMCVLHTPNKPYPLRLLFSDKREPLTIRPEGKPPACVFCKDRTMTKGTFEFIHKPNAVGDGVHRSGWPWVIQHLRKHEVEGAPIRLNDFVEQTFMYQTNQPPITDPWVGIFHHPPSLSPCFSPKSGFAWLYRNMAFLQSLPTLKLAIALSDHLTRTLSELLPCPVVSLKHPIDLRCETWSPEDWRQGKKRIYAIGAYCRNTRVLHQTEVPFGVQKIQFWGVPKWAANYDEMVNYYWMTNRLRPNVSAPVRTGRASNGAFDAARKTGVFIQEFFDCSAANGVLDCIASHTPMFVNWHPAVVEYLGPEYPLYFETPRDVMGLWGRIEAAHEYLKAMDKQWLDGDYFANRVVEEIAKVC